MSWLLKLSRLLIAGNITHIANNRTLLWFCVDHSSWEVIYNFRINIYLGKRYFPCTEIIMGIYICFLHLQSKWWNRWSLLQNRGSIKCTFSDNSINSIIIMDLNEYSKIQCLNCHADILRTSSQSNHNPTATTIC